MMKERLRKSIVRAVFIFLWGWLMHYFYIEEGQIDIFKMWLLIGFPFGIYKIHLWLIPKNLDIGGTVGVWTMNISYFVPKARPVIFFSRSGCR